MSFQPLKHTCDCSTTGNPCESVAVISISTWVVGVSKSLQCWHIQDECVSFKSFDETLVCTPLAWNKLMQMLNLTIPPLTITLWHNQCLFFSPKVDNGLSAIVEQRLLFLQISLYGRIAKHPVAKCLHCKCYQMSQLIDNLIILLQLHKTRTSECEMAAG